MDLAQIPASFTSRMFSANHSTSLSLNFLTCETGLVIDGSSSNGGSENLNKVTGNRENAPNMLFAT